MPCRDESPEPRCALCATPLEPGQTERFATRDLCRLCFDGDFGDRLAHRGIRVQQLGLFTRQMDGQRTPRAYTLVNGACGHDLSLRASFGREGLISRIGKLFRPELQVGDPLFDDDVLIWTTDKEELGRLLRAESLQSLIHTAVCELAEHELPVTVEGPRVELRSQQMPSASGDDYLRRLAALLLHHLAQDAGRRGLPSLQSPPLPLFDLDRACASFISGEKLTALDVRFDRLEDLGQLERLKRESGHDRLERVGLNDLRLGSSDLRPLALVPGLVSLSLARVPDVVDLSGLAEALALERLDLYGCPVRDIAPLAGLDRLEELNLNYTQVSDLGPLGRPGGGLKRLFVQHSEVQDLSPLASLDGLQWLNIRDTGVSDLGPILGHRRLQRLDLHGSRVPAEQLERLRASLPALQVDPH